MTIDSNKFIILKLPSNKENRIFIYHTFGTIDYVVFDKRISKFDITAKQEIFDVEFYKSFKSKCLKVEVKQLSLTINEFIFLARIIDFVNKCYLSKIRSKLIEVLKEDFKKVEIDYDEQFSWYSSKSTQFFNDFKNSCKNEELLGAINAELGWSI